MPSYHEGEIAVQERTGQREAGARLGGSVHGTIPERARDFVASVSTLAVSAAAADGAVWISLWRGTPGFVEASDDGAAMLVERSEALVSPDDPLRTIVGTGHAVGTLAIDLATRRRLRVNGTVAAAGDRALRIAVDEAFANCPKYIQRRQAVPAASAPAEAAPPAEGARRGERLDAGARALVERADTAFIGTAHPARGVDASHRGGEPGFVRVDAGGDLVIPDYAGNGMFKTLGNLSVSPRAGLAVVDFERGRLLSMTGRGSVSFPGAAPEGRGETERLVRFRVEAWVEFAMPGRSRWLLLDRSQFNPPITAPLR